MGLHPRLPVCEHLQRGASGAGAAHRLSELEPLALRGATSGAPRTRRCPPARGLARSLSRYAAASARRAGRVETHRGDAARALSGRPACRRFRTRARTRSEARTAARLRCRSERLRRRWPATRPLAVRICALNGASRGAIETLDRVARRLTYADGRYPNNGFAGSLRTVAGAIVRGIGSRVLGVDRRLRHACGAGRWRWRRLRA